MHGSGSPDLSSKFASRVFDGDRAITRDGERIAALEAWSGVATLAAQIG